MWYVYSLWPIDHGWEFLTPLNKFIEQIGTSEALVKVLHGDAGYIEHISIAQLSADWQSAKTAAAHHGWEGDITAGPGVFMVPTNDFGFLHGFAFKQQNNGMTFVISPCKLAWLEERAESHSWTPGPPPAD